MREAQFLSHRQLSARLGGVRTSIQYFERAEEGGTITLNNLRKCAEAMDCELVYALRPKDGESPARRIWNLLLKEVQHNPSLAHNRLGNRALRLAAILRDKMFDPAFRQSQGWPRNSHPEAHEVTRVTKVNRALSRMSNSTCARPQDP